MQKQTGFTLIEVLIAIVILAIALLAIYSAVSSSISTDAHIKGKMSAHDVAMSVVSNLQAGLMPVPSSDIDATNPEKVFGQAWLYHIKTISKADHYAIVSVNITGKNDHSLSDTMTAWVFTPVVTN